MNEKSAKDEAKLPQEKLDTIQALRQALHDATQTKYIQLKTKLENLISSLEKDYPAYFHFKYNRNVPNIATVREKLLNDTTAFLEYFMGDSVIYALQISKDTLQIDRITYTEAEIECWQEMLDWASLYKLYENEYSTFQSISIDLAKKLWHPISSKINHYLIAPDGWLNKLNF